MVGTFHAVLTNLTSPILGALFILGLLLLYTSYRAWRRYLGPTAGILGLLFIGAANIGVPYVPNNTMLTLLPSTQFTSVTRLGFATPGDGGRADYVTAWGATATFSGNVSPGDTLSLNGVAISFVSGAPVSNQVQVGGSLGVTLTNLTAFLSSMRLSNPALNGLSYGINGSVFNILNVVPGAAYAIAKSSTAITLSGSVTAQGVGGCTQGASAAGDGGWQVP